MRYAAGLLLLPAVLLSAGCVVATATVATATAITATSIKAVGKVTTATVATGGKVAAAALNPSEDVEALSLESAARLARAGMVVLVDAETGVVCELPWHEGLQLQEAMEAGKLHGVFKAAKLFREGRSISGVLKDGGASPKMPVLRAGDVVELIR